MRKLILRVKEAYMQLLKCKCGHTYPVEMVTQVDEPNAEEKTFALNCHCGEVLTFKGEKK
jgi:hypothetical protein